ncbi:MAG: DUF4442 domain-containing protein [Pseudomonadota bacterium]
MKTLFNLYPPFLGTGITVKSISRDFRHVRVEMKLRWYNSNYVKTHFGGSLYAMTDPFYMVMLMNILGSDYLVWDRSAFIEFIKPGKGTVHADFLITEDQISHLITATANGEKHLPEFSIDILDKDQTLVARVMKQLYIKKKPGRPT